MLRAAPVYRKILGNHNVLHEHACVNYNAGTTGGAQYRLPNTCSMMSESKAAKHLHVMQQMTHSRKP
jgi:hypothetical protein